MQVLRPSPGSWVVGIDLPPRKSCARPALTRIEVRRDGIEHTSQALLAFTITGIAPTLTTKVTFTAVCQPAAPPPGDPTGEG
ncbi:MAG: hypothetical protein ACT4QG_03530 [Sporichthyaceae bacterium]